MGGTSTPATTTQIQKTELPAWVDAASQANYASAQQVADRPFQQFEGPRVAGLSAGEQAAPGIVSAGMTGANTAYSGASQALQAAGAYQPSQVGAPAAVGNVTAGNVQNNNLSGYLNPYTNSVVDTTLAGLDRNNAMAVQSNDDAARAQGSWGSSRSGVTSAVLQSEGIRNKAATEANLRANAFTQAQGAAQTDNQSALQAALANQGKDTTANAQTITAQSANQAAGLSAANLGLQSGVAQAGLGDSITNSAGKNALLTSQLGANDRSVQQAGIDANMAKFQEEYDAPLTALNTKLAALGMSPYGKTTNTTGTSQSQSSSNGLLSGIGAAASFLPFLFSDRKTKKNIEKIGPTGAPGINAYEYEYKGFMGKPGRQVGVMADEIKGRVPGAVKRMEGPDGKKYDAVNYGRVAQHVAEKRSFMGRAA